jgi:hypothetical protein
MKKNKVLIGLAGGIVAFGLAVIKLGFPTTIAFAVAIGICYLTMEKKA